MQSLDLTLIAHIAGIAAILGSLLYAIGDVLMLAPRLGGGTPQVQPDVFAPLGLPARRNRLLADLASISPRRVVAGGLIGVFATPLTFGGAALIYLALRPAGAWLALPPALLTGFAAAVAPFIHGSFIYVGQQAHAYAAAPAAQREPLGALLRGALTTIFSSYAALFIAVVLASLWFVAVVLSGRAGLPAWVALANPVLLITAWLALMRVAPRPIVDATQGAGLNIGSLGVLGVLTAVLW